jgi:MFS transporter, FSR family, fosmidomycin resistance protein
MGVACGAHVLHDGYTDLLYVLLPIWQAQFGLGYAEVGMLRALFTGSMAGLQVPAGILAERIGGPLVLGLGTALVGVGFLAASFLIEGVSAGYGMLALALVVAGTGAAVQHPIAAHLSRRRFPADARAPPSPAIISRAISVRWRSRPPRPVLSR